MARLYLGIGSNLDAEKNLRLGVQELGKRFDLLEVSPIYRNAAVGFDGGEFLNAVACVSTDLTPHETTDELEEIHDMAGRQRGMTANVSRTLDIDLLLYDDLVIDQPPVRVPRKDILEYAFVLAPLADIAPNTVHPATGRTIADHWADFDKSDNTLVRVDLILND